LVSATVALNRAARSSSHAVSLKAPLFALVMGVRRAEQITTSSSACAASSSDFNSRARARVDHRDLAYETVRLCLCECVAAGEWL